MFSIPMAETNPDLIRFPKLNIQFNVKSTAFHIFNASVTWYGVLITIGMMLAMIYGFARMRKFGIDSDRAIDGVIGGVIGAIIGARAYYVLFHLKDYSGNWKSMFNIRQGGLAIYGGIIGALLVGSVVCKLRKVRLLPMFDLTALGLLIGQSIGRWGNFMNHEAFGKNTDNIFGMTSERIRNWIINNGAGQNLDPDYPVHPCFLYESAWCLLGFLILHFISKKFRKFDGQIFLMYIVWYGAGRFFIEGLRTDSLYLGTVKISQAVALVSVVVGLILLIIGFSRTKRLGTDYQLYVDTAESKRLLEESDRREQEWQEKHLRKKQKAEAETTHVLLDMEDYENAADTAAETEDAEPEKEEPADNPIKEEAETPEAEKQEEPEAESSENEDPAAAAKAENDAKIDALLDEIAAKSAPKKKKKRKK